MKIIVAGEFRDTPFNAVIKNPYTDEPIGNVSLAQSSDISIAIEKAINAQDKITALDTEARKKILLSIAERIAKEKDTFAHLITSEVAKPISLSRVEVERCVTTFRIAAEECERLFSKDTELEIGQSSQKRKALLRYVPSGVALFITPFNFPLNLVAHKVAPAIGIGTPFIIKPAPQAPLTALKLAEIILESGFPPVGVSVLPCENNIAEQMVRDERIKILSFTGSAEVGWYLRSISKARKIILECGGNAGVILDDEIDDKTLEFAVQRCVGGAFAYAGQICISVQRIFVHKKIYTQFKEKFLETTRNVKVGDPMKEDVLMSVLINEQAVERTEQLIARAVEQRGTFALKGMRNGKLLTPFILENVTNDMDICQEEIFAPVAVLIPFENFDEALSMVNDSRYGLQAGVFTSNSEKIKKAFDKLEVGGIIVNDVPTFRVDDMPYGGVKDSGLGREGPRYAMLEMIEPRLLVLPG